MGVVLLPDIGKLDPESLCYGIYTKLYQNFFNAQDAGTVVEGDDISIRLRNTAYGFADAIAGSVTGEGGSSGSGTLAAYLKRSGGDMTGLLRADYGFTAGINNTRVLEIFDEESSQGVRITGRLCVDADGFILGGQRVFYYQGATGTTQVDSKILSLGSTLLQTETEVIVGKRETGVLLSPTSILIAGQAVYHHGNANNEDTDWVMKDALITGTLSADGDVTMNGSLTALHGVMLGDGGNTRLQIAEDRVNMNADMHFAGSHALYFNEKAVMAPIGDNSLALNAPGNELLLGYTTTIDLRIMSPLKDQQGTHTLLTANGEAFFPGSLRAAHNLGPDLLSTYDTGSQDMGIIVHHILRLGTADGPAFERGADGIVQVSTATSRIVEGGIQKSWHKIQFGHEISGSPLAPSDRSWNDMVLSSDARHIHLGNPLYADNFLAVAQSVTRLEKECLFLTDTHSLRSVAGGIKHYGQALFMDGISSEFFSSGLAGAGWAVLQNKTTGSVIATFDEIVVRRRMRAYELEVQSTRVTDGSLWISNSCCGDSVEKLL